MILIDSKIEKDLTISENTSIEGQVIGNVYLTESSCLELRGLIIGNLYISDGCEAYIHGTIHGNIENQGGTLHITGIVNGNISTPKEKIKIDYKAQILGLLMNKSAQ